MAVLAEREHDFDQARSHFARLIDKVSGNKLFQSRLDASREVENGIALKGQGKTKEALAAFRSALKLDARHELAWFHISQILSGLGMEEEASKNRTRAVKLAPELRASQFLEMRMGAADGDRDSGLSRRR